MTTLVVGHGNIHNNIAAITAALAMNCDVFGFNEAGRRIPTLAGVRGFRLHTAYPVRKWQPQKKFWRVTSTDTATLVRKKYEYLGELQQQVSQQWDPAARVAPDRWFNVACFGVQGKRVAHLNIHPNAGPKQLTGDNPNHPIVREYRESMVWMESILDLYAHRGYALLVTGDFNLRDYQYGKDPEWSPWTRLRKHGLAYKAHKIDGIAWSAKHFEMRDFHVIPKARFHSDHDALRVTLTTK